MVRKESTKWNVYVYLHVHWLRPQNLKKQNFTLEMTLVYSIKQDAHTNKQEKGALSTTYMSKWTVLLLPKCILIFSHKVIEQKTTFSNNTFCQLTFFPTYVGAVLTSKTQSDKQLEKAKHQAKSVIHALHKAQDKMDEFEVCSTVNVQCWENSNKWNFFFFLCVANSQIRRILFDFCL